MVTKTIETDIYRTGLIQRNKKLKNVIEGPSLVVIIVDLKY